MWANKTLYTHVTLKALNENDEPQLVELPDCAREQEEESDFETSEEEEIYKTPEQIEELITFSTVANSRWQNLLNIDIIKKRNKPKAPPKLPQSAPFFLPTIPSLNFQFDLRSSEKAEGEMFKTNSLIELSPFGKLLDETKATQNYLPVIEKLKTLGPSMIDFEINSLNPEGLGSVEVMVQFLKCIKYMFESNRDFELAQAYLGVFLKAHARVIAGQKCLRELLPELQIAQNIGWQKIQDKLLYNLCVVQTLKTL